MTRMSVSSSRWPSLALAMALAACAGEAPPQAAGEATPGASPGAAADDGVALTEDPIALVGHGALIDGNGAEIVPDREFVLAVQDYYLRQLQAQADAAVLARLHDAEAALARQGLGARDDERAFVNMSLVRWLAQSTPGADSARLAAKSAALYLAYQQLDAPLQPDGQPLTFPAIEEALREAGIVHHTPRAGASYETKCKDAGVPTPPAWGSASWKKSGVLTNEFISSSLDAEVYYFASTSPRGTCIALPRSSGNTISLLGIICHGVDTSKACFWDNSNVPKGTSVPIAEFRKGDSSEIAIGGTCTDCHAGENPFIVHPGTALDLASKVPAASWATKNWYDPLIHSSLPQNPGPTNAIAALSVGTGQGSCDSCHAAMRLPDLSKSLSGYCSAVLDNAVAKTMPPGGAGSLDYSKHIKALNARCDSKPASALCAPDNAKICAQAGGYCEQAFSTSGNRHDLCRWPDARTKSACDGTAGIWTPAGSGFADGWPTAVPAGASGACITQMRNIGGTRSTEAACTAANRELCRRHGGFCEDATSTSGGNHQLCRWPNHDTAAKCETTDGIWTTSTSGFAKAWPTAVRANEAGACITQMNNIGGTPN